ncbi:eukaryotic translation initiation factor 3 subunit F-like protein [Euroglyphus maynei]|uniref:Eukaryotic translation initiation factor 3 subunit F-like protein n=1 Tax=Euroglyphus maynei TaxID=6958 RepID=A0A1Y3BGA4_EURMA|nr:eukaryotic translation initiation factor 3 subunit F-like protein [Euroglyphus maynei]
MSNTSVRVHPLVVYNIIDIYERRNLDANRVIGTLLGSVDKLGNVEVSNSFVVKHREANNEVAVDLEVAKELYELHKKVFPSETIVGWFATGGGEVNEYSVVIHDYYSRECQNPIHLTVDPSADGISVKAYVSTIFGIPGKNVGTMFTPIDDITISYCYEPELVGVRACMYAAGLPSVSTDSKEIFLANELDQIIQMCNKCQDNIARIVKFIEEKILSGASKGSIPSNTNDIGRQLMAMIENIIPFGGDDDEAFNSNLKDFLMVVYLSNLSKTQLGLNEKISHLLATERPAVTGPVQILLQTMQDKFQAMSDEIVHRMDEMGHRINDLEQNINDLMQQADSIENSNEMFDSQQSNKSQSVDGKQDQQLDEQ